MEKPITANAEVQVQFYDLDSMNVAWHGNYVKYMETARCALLEKIDYDYSQMENDGFVWPIVHLEIKYIRPLRFMQKVRIETTLVEYQICMKIRYKFIDTETGKVVSKAETTQMAVDLKTRESLIGSPPCFLEKVRKFLDGEENA